jgi:hypothetical protein
VLLQAPSIVAHKTRPVISAANLFLYLINKLPFQKMS